MDLVPRTPRRIGHYCSALSICVLGLLVSCNQPNLELNKEYPVPGEEEEFRQHVKIINEIQKKLSKDSKDNALHRGFHAKAHGCLRGQLIVLPDRPTDTMFGIFKENKTYPDWIRFSNGVGFDQSDKEPDVRGLAIKVMDIEGKKLMESEANAKTQDFLMTNNPMAVTHNAKEFIEFAEALASGKVSLALFAVTHPKSGYLLATQIFRDTRSLLTEQYWSGAPIMLGSRAIKFSAVPSTGKPCAPFEKPLLKDRGPDYLTSDLINHAKGQPICFDFLVQFQADPYETPIEDALVEWKNTDAPFVKVARLVLPKQEFYSENQNRFCELLDFTPWHALPEHKPLGNMNRARKKVYEASQVFRKNGHHTPEPDGSEEF